MGCILREVGGRVGRERSVATGLGLVTQKIAMRTLHIRAKSFVVPLLAAVSFFVVWTSVISMGTVAKVPARFAHWTVAVD